MNYEELYEDDILQLKAGATLECECGASFYIEDILPDTREIVVGENTREARIRPVGSLCFPLRLISYACMFDGVL